MYIDMYVRLCECVSVTQLGVGVCVGACLYVCMCVCIKCEYVFRVCDVFSVFVNIDIICDIKILAQNVPL